MWEKLRPIFRGRGRKRPRALADELDALAGRFIGLDLPALLGRLQWSQRDEVGGRCCPECEVMQSPRGHALDCAMGHACRTLRVGEQAGSRSG